MAFDIAVKELALVAEEEGVAIEIMDENDEPALDDAGNPVTITACGINSPTYRAADAWLRKHVRSFSGRPMTAEENAAAQAEFVARCCKGWSGFTDNGQSVPFNTANAAQTFRRLPFVQRQIESRIGQHRFFSKTN